jgi:hypothetical protein
MATMKTAMRIAVPSIQPVSGCSIMPTMRDTMEAAIRIMMMTSSKDSKNSWRKVFMGDSGKTLVPKRWRSSITWAEVRPSFTFTLREAARAGRPPIASRFSLFC